MLLFRSLVLAAALPLIAADVMPGQSSDWLVKHRPELKTVLKKTATGVALTNGLIERAFFTKGGAFCTVDLRHVHAEVTYFRAISTEGNVTLNGTGFEIGGTCT